MSIMPMPPGPLRDKVTGTKSAPQEIGAWKQANPGGGFSYLGGSPTFDEGGGGQAPPAAPQQQQGALQQAIQGPGLEEFMSGVQTRGQQKDVGGNKALGAGAGALSGAATGAGLGSIVPGIGNAIGAGIGAAVGGLKGLLGSRGIRQGQVTDLSAQDARGAVAAAYRDKLGREATPQEIDSHLGNNKGQVAPWISQGIWSNALNNIGSSPEAQAYAAKMAQPQAAPQAAPEQAAVQQAIAGPPAGGKGGILEGFNADKMNMGMDKQMKSPKYAFAAVAQKYDQSDPAQRQAMLAELKQHPSGFFKDAQLTGNKGDILDVGEQTDPVWGGIRKFDVIRGAGEGGKAWQWGAQGGDSGGGGAAPGGIGADYNASGDPILAAIGGQSLNPVTRGMDMLKKLLGEIPGGINSLAGGQ